MNIIIPPPLHSYTKGASRTEVRGGTIADVLFGLDARYPGLRFRIIDEQDAIRPHIKLFLNGEEISRLDRAARPGDELQIICALSGG